MVVLVVLNNILLNTQKIGRRVKVYSNRKQKWFANINPVSKEYTHNVFYEFTEFSKKYDYEYLYLKYKAKYLQLKNKSSRV